MSRALACLICIILVPATSSLAVAEKVALRAANGHFLHPGADGGLRAEALYPSDKETFELVSRGPHEVALQAPGGRYLTPDPRDGRTPRLGAAGIQPADRETFQLVPAEANRFALRAHGSQTLLVFLPPARNSPGPKAPVGPAPGETVEIYRMAELPAILQAAFPAVLRSLAVEELAGKKYDQTQKHETEKHIDLPAPTLKDPRRMKRHQILGITEEYRVQAQLDGQAGIRFPAMLLLTNYADGGPSLILLAVDANVPVRGQVEGKVSDLADASTGYHMTVQISAVAEVVARDAGHDVAFDPPIIRDLHVSISRIDFSNDVLEALRRQVRRVLNRELAHNESRIRESANRALQKAIADRNIRIPLIGYLRLL